MEPFSASKPQVCYEVEKIIGVSSNGNMRSYRVQWAPSWVSSFHLVGCEHLIQDYLRGSPLNEECRHVDETRALQGCLQQSSDTNSRFENEELQVFLQGSAEEEIRHRREILAQKPKEPIQTLEHSQSNKLPANLERSYNFAGLQQHGNHLRHTERSSADRESPTRRQDSLSPLSSEDIAVTVSDRDNDPSSCFMKVEEDDNREIAGELSSDRTLIKSEEMEDDVKVYILTADGEMNDSATPVEGDDNKQPQTDDYVHEPMINESNYSSQQSYLERDLSYSTDTARKDSDDSLLSPNASSPQSSSHSRGTVEAHHLQSDSTFSNPVYPCSTCHKIFSSKNQLDMHFRCHSGERPYICSYCGKTYSQKGNLNRHIRSHMGVKPYECEICSKAFAQKGHLRDHVLTHSGLKPYQCNLCEKAYIRKNHLKEHLQTHGVETS